MPCPLVRSRSNPTTRILMGAYSNKLSATNCADYAEDPSASPAQSVAEKTTIWSTEPSIQVLRPDKAHRPVRAAAIRRRSWAAVRFAGSAAWTAVQQEQALPARQVQHLRSVAPLVFPVELQSRL